METNLEKNGLVELTAEIVSAYVSNNTVVAGDLPGVIHNVFDALSRASTATACNPRRVETRRAGEEIGHARIHRLPRGRQKVQIAEASLAHALRPVAGGLSRKMGSPHDYPMVAPNYAAACLISPSAWVLARGAASLPLKRERRRIGASPLEPRGAR